MVIDLQAFSLALVGGVIIGIASSMLMLFLGRIAGISGITAGLVKPSKGEVDWRLGFTAGLVIGGLALTLFYPDAFPNVFPRSPVVTAVAGLFVGIGTQLGNGCTSGHGICGISRLSARSMVATATFIATGAMAVVLVRLLGVS